MCAQPHPVIDDAGIGRLPPPVVDFALSERQFRRIAETWRDRGVWVSLWTAGGAYSLSDESAGPFWDGLLRSNAAKLSLHAEISDCVRKVIAAEQGNRDVRPALLCRLNGFQEDFKLAVIPIRVRHRCTGAVVALAATSSAGGEDFTRLCTQAGVDRAAMETLRKGISNAAETIEVWSRLLALSVEQARELDAAQGEIASLTNNLESTYEELHLIYEISRVMGIPQKPAQMLERVSREMLEVSRAAGMAFVLPERADVAGGAAPTRASDRVVQVGRCAPSLDMILKLDASVPDAMKLESDHILFNKAMKRSEFEWASEWLKHFVALPLRLDGELLGMVYGINVVDDGDYTSVDIQLLKAVADRISAALKNQHLYDDLADLLMGLMHALVNSVDAKDPYTFGHSERVAYFSRAIAQAAGMSAIDCERVYLAGLLHDVGKIGVPDAILTKPGRLTAEEFEALKRHPEIGERILSHIRQLRDLLPGVLYHHERMDGRGYPRRIAGKDIPLLGRIICLADSFDAMTSNRTYRAALPIPVATAEIRRCAGNQFDPALAELFLKIGPQKLYEEAKENTKGDPDIGRIGALCTVLSGRPNSGMAFR